MRERQPPITQIKVTDGEITPIKERLGAVLDTYRGRSAIGSDIEVLELTKSDRCADLTTAESFDDFVEGYEPASVVLRYAHNGVGDVRVYLATVNGTVWFRANVPEEVIDHVYETIRAIRYGA